MELPFLTLPKYDGRKLAISSARPVLGGGHTHQWDEDAPEDEYGNVFRKVREILAGKGETVAAGARLVGGCCGTTPDAIREIARRMGRGS